MLLQTKQWLAYIYSMPSKPIELPPAVARRFLEDMRAFFAQESPIKRDEIAGRQITDFPWKRNPARAGVLERGSRRFA